MEKPNAKSHDESSDQMFMHGSFLLIESLIGGLSHDLRQPLNVSKILTQSLLRDIEKGRLDPKRLGESLQRMVEQVNLLAAMLDHLRAFFIASGGKFSIAPLSVQQVIEQSMEIFTTQFTHHGITMESDFSAGIASVYTADEGFKMMLVCVLTAAKLWLDDSEEDERGKLRLAAASDESAGGLVTLNVSVTLQPTHKGREDVAIALENAGWWLAQRIVVAQGGSFAARAGQDGGWILDVKMPVKLLDPKYVKMTRTQ